MSFILLVACTFLVYLAEKSDDQPGKEPEAGELGNLGDGLYWGIVSGHIYIFSTSVELESENVCVCVRKLQNL